MGSISTFCSMLKRGYALHHHLRDYPHGSNAPDRRSEEIVRWEALVFFPLAVYQGKTRDRLADEAPQFVLGPEYLARAVDVGRQDAGHALSIVGRQGAKGQSLLEEQLY